MSASEPATDLPRPHAGSRNETMPSSDDRTTILWDTWGVPHIFAPDEPALFRAYGYAQMHNHAGLLLRLYG
jgi:acyl-homoserine-lactone acylase